MPEQHTANGKVITYHEFVAQVDDVRRTRVGYVLVVAISSQVLGAIKHHVLDRDFTLLTMLGRTEKQT